MQKIFQFQFSDLAGEWMRSEISEFMWLFTVTLNLRRCSAQFFTPAEKCITHHARMTKTETTTHSNAFKRKAEQCDNLFTEADKWLEVYKCY